jgi:prophage regulatory protein
MASVVDPIIRFPEAAASRGLSRSTCYVQIAQGLMPRPIKNGARMVGWFASEIAAINAARAAGKGDDEIRALVRQLEAQRVVQMEAA